LNPEDFTAIDYRRISLWAAKIAPIHIREDARSTALVAIATALSEYNSEGDMSPISYVRQIARQRVVDYLRREWKEDTVASVKPRDARGRPLSSMSLNYRSCIMGGTSPSTPEQIIQARESIQQKQEAAEQRTEAYYYRKDETGKVIKKFVRREQQKSPTFYRGNMPLGIFRNKLLVRGRNAAQKKQRTISLAERRGNVPDPGRDGFPWS